jgi:predicted O-linked N-acetylglucosamine transferase (SPINDLY family)
MPHCYQVNDNEPYCDDTPMLRSDVSLREDAFVFCCFNTSYKIDAKLFKSWMNILKRAPHSVLWLLEHSREQRSNLEKSALKFGLDASRLTFAPRVPKDRHLARLSLADLALDTVCVNGAASTSDALWAGVPVLTVRGSHFASRMSSSILEAAGLTDLIVNDLKAYEDCAGTLANNRSKLQRFQRMLKENGKRTHLFNTKEFVAHLEKSYKMMWHRYLTGNRPCQIDLNRCTY